MEDGSLARRRADPNKTRKTLESSRDAALKDFNRTLKLIVKAMHTKQKQDMDLAELKSHLDIAISDAPLDVFERVGKYIWDYREDIAKSNVDEFMRKDYKKELEQEVTEESEITKFMELIQKIKRTWRLFNTVEQQDIIKKFQNLVKQYAIFEGCNRELLKLPSNE